MRRRRNRGRGGEGGGREEVLGEVALAFLIAAVDEGLRTNEFGV